MNAVTPEQVTTAHTAYCRATDMELSLSSLRERAWFEFLKLFSLQDLLLVIGYLKKEIKLGKRNLGSLKFHNMIESHDHFEEDLALVRKLSRQRPAKFNAERTVGDIRIRTEVDPSQADPKHMSEYSEDAMQQISDFRNRHQKGTRQ